MLSLAELRKQILKEQEESKKIQDKKEQKMEFLSQKLPGEKKHDKSKQLPKLNKSIELNLIKSLYANRFGSTTNKLKTDMQKAIIDEWKELI